MKALLESIEALRKSMIELGMEKGLRDPEVIALSEELDALINKYYKGTV